MDYTNPGGDDATIDYGGDDAYVSDALSRLNRIIAFHTSGG